MEFVRKLEQQYFEKIRFGNCIVLNTVCYDEKLILCIWMEYGLMVLSLLKRASIEY